MHRRFFLVASLSACLCVVSDVEAKGPKFKKWKVKYTVANSLNEPIKIAFQDWHLNAEGVVEARFQPEPPQEVAPQSFFESTVTVHSPYGTSPEHDFEVSVVGLRSQKFWVAPFPTPTPPLSSQFSKKQQIDITAVEGECVGVVIRITANKKHK